jgi:hypothetical protein
LPELRWQYRRYRSDLFSVGQITAPQEFMHSTDMQHRDSTPRLKCMHNTGLKVTATLITGIEKARKAGYRRNLGEWQFRVHFPRNLPPETAKVARF